MEAIAWQNSRGKKVSALEKDASSKSLGGSGVSRFVQASRGSLEVQIICDFQWPSCFIFCGQGSQFAGLMACSQQVAHFKVWCPMEIPLVDRGFGVLCLKLVMPYVGVFVDVRDVRDDALVSKSDTYSPRAGVAVVDDVEDGLTDKENVGVAPDEGVCPKAGNPAEVELVTVDCVAGVDNDAGTPNEGNDVPAEATEDEDDAEEANPKEKEGSEVEDDAAGPKDEDDEVPKEKPEVEVADAAPPKENPGVEAEDAGAPKDRLGVEAEEAGAPKDKLGVEAVDVGAPIDEAGVPKDKGRVGSGETVVDPNGEPETEAEDTGVANVKPEFEDAGVEAAVKDEPKEKPVNAVVVAVAVAVVADDEGGLKLKAGEANADDCGIEAPLKENPDVVCGAVADDEENKDETVG
eukprot:Gb_25246 [translate_table: standard]